MVLGEEYYEKKFKSIRNILLNSINGYKLAAISKDGSRERQTNRPDSDLDIIFAIEGDPSREKFCPYFEKILRFQFPQAKVGILKSGVITLDFTNGGKFDIVLISKKQLAHQRRNLRAWRGKHL